MICVKADAIFVRLGFVTMNKELMYFFGVIILALNVVDAAIPQQNLERKNSKDKGKKRKFLLLRVVSK